MKLFKFWQNQFERLSRGRKVMVFLAAGAITGAASVVFMRAFEFVLHHPLRSYVHGPWLWLAVPVLFVLAVEIVRNFAPFADGAGIPQTVFAAEHLTETSLGKIYPLVSMRTMSVKIIALLIAVWAGASTGREGPTVHVAACLFLGFVLLMRRFLGVKLDLRSAVVAGGAAGLAAAFNTPLAGVTFAIEELSANYFVNIKEAVLMAIILAGIAAKSLTGEYNYFGHLAAPASVSFLAIIFIGIAGGVFGALFSSALVHGRKLVAGNPSRFWRFAFPALFALAILLVNRWSAVEIFGPGNKAAEELVRDGFKPDLFAFPAWKMVATLMTYWAGIAGGIFAPCLSIGAGLGADIGMWSGDATTACAVIGMAAFLAGTIQAPMTAFVIIFEMTGYHQMLLPVMLASLTAVMTARLLGARHLYQSLAHFYGEKLEPPQMVKAA